MSDETCEKLLVQTLKGVKKTRAPFWFMRQAGRYLPEYLEIRSQMGSFWDLVYSPEKASLVTLQPIERFGMDGAILFSDILVVPEALGQKVTFKPGIGPVLEPLDFTAEHFGLLNGQGVEKTDSIFETVRRVKAGLDDKTALIGFAGSPWTVATYMVEGKGTPEKAGTLKFVRENPARFQELYDLIIATTVQYLLGQIEAGAEVLQLFDSWAGALKKEEEFYTWCINPTKKIIDQIRKEAPDIPLIGFAKGIGSFYKDYFKETKLDAISIDFDVDLEWAAKELQPFGCLQGNLDPALLVEGGDKMITQAEKILETLGGGAHVFNLGHGIVPETPVENIAALSRFLKSL